MTHTRVNKRRRRRGGKKFRLAHMKCLYLENRLKTTPAEYPPELTEWTQRIEGFAKILGCFNPTSKPGTANQEHKITEEQTLAVVKGLIKRAKLERKQGNFQEFLTSIDALLTEKADVQKEMEENDDALGLNDLKQNRPSVIAWAAQNDDVPATSCLLVPKLEPSSESSSDASTITFNGSLDQITEPS